MKNKLVLGFAATLAVAAIAAAPAQTVYWDTNGATPGFASPTTAGTWVTGGSANNFWTTDSTGVVAGAAWADNESAVFYSPTAPGVANTVATSGTINVAGITFQNGRWAFTGTSTINLGSGGLTYGVPLGGSAGMGSTFAAAESFVLGASQTWTGNANNNSNQWVINGTVTGAAATNVTLTLSGNLSGSATPGSGSGFTFAGILGDGLGGTLGVTVNALDTNLGAFILSGANTYSGATTVTSGALQVATVANGGIASGLGKGTSVSLGGAAGTTSILNFVNSGSANSSTDRTINVVGTGGAAEIENNSSNAAATLTLTGNVVNGGGGANRTFILGGTNAGANAVNGIISDNADLTTTKLQKNDAGLWVLNGANTFSGGVLVSGGTLQLGASGTLGQNVSGNLITIGGGNLLLGASGNIGSNQSIVINSGGIGVTYDPTSIPTIVDNTGTAGGIFGINYVGAGGIGSVAGINNLFSSTSYWFLGSFVGGAGTYTGTSLTAGNGNTYRLGGGGGALTLLNNILVDNGSAANALFGGTGGGSVTLSSGNTYTGTTTIQNGTVNVSSMKSVGGGASSLGAQATVGNGAIAMGSGSNAVGLNYTGTGDTTDRILNFVGTSGTITLSNSGTGAINYTSAPIFNGAGSKTLTLGNATDTVGGSIGAITNNSSTNKTTLVENGVTNSTWILTGGSGNTFTGTTTVNGGVLQTAAPSDLASTVVTLNGSVGHEAVWQTAGTLSQTLGTGLSWKVYSGFAAKGGSLTLNFNGGTPLVWAATAGFMGSGSSPMVFGSSTSDSQVVLQNAVDFGAATANFDRVIAVEGNAATIVGGTANNGVSGSSALISGAITALNGQGNDGFKKTGSGTLILTNTGNTYSGPTTVSAGTLILGASTTSTTSVQSANVGIVNAGSTQITVANATGVTIGELVIGAGIATGTTVQGISGNIITLSTGTTAAIASGGDTLTFGQAGVLGVDSAPIVLGFASVNGTDGTTANNASPTLLIGGAYTVFTPITITSSATASTSGTFGIGGSTDNNATFSGAIAANQGFSVTQAATSGSNALTIASAINGGTAAGSRAVTFNNVGAVNDTGIIGGGTGTLSVAKTNTGVLTLSGANTYSGGTAIGGGVVRVGNNAAFGTGTVTVSGGQLSSSGTTGYTLANAMAFSGVAVLGDKTNTGALAFTNAACPTVAASTTLQILSNVSFAALSLPSTTTLSFDLTNAPLLTLGTFTENAALAFDFTNFIVGQLYQIAAFTTGIGLNTGSFTLTGDLGGYTAAWSLTGASLGVTLTSAVPEPSTWALFGAGAAALALGFRRRRAA